MPLTIDLDELVPTEGPLDEKDTTTWYRLTRGKITFRRAEIKGADPQTFRYYRGLCGKDKNHCYGGKSRLKGANPATFRALNFTYFTDGKLVWAMGIPVKDADAATFEVCDDGRKDLDGLIIPHGYGKDAQRVFYYNFDGKPNWVRKANPATFRSHNTGHFGQDENFAFFEIAAIAKAKVATWRPLVGWFSKDDQRAWFCNRPLPDADAETFIAIDAGVTYIHLAKDKNRYWDTDTIISVKQYADKLAKFGDPKVYLKYAE